jgi:hypothetical protein
MQLVEEVIDAAGRLRSGLDPADFGGTLVAVHREYGVEVRPDRGRGIVTPPAQRHRPVRELTPLGDHTKA